MIGRRKFGKILAMGSACYLAPFSMTTTDQVKSKFKPLKKGDKIGLIAPAFRIDQERINVAKANLEELGFECFYTDRIFERHGYLAGKDEVRLAEIHKMFLDSSVDGIWCVEGGYGTTRILDRLDFNLIRQNPKPIIGFSDVTALLQAIFKKTRNPCFHSLNIGYPITDYTKHNLAPIFGLDKPFSVNLYEDYNSFDEEIYKIKTLIPGKAKGRLVGGNLSLLTSLIGTAHELKAKDAIVFIEDIGEQPYRIDRMLTQLLSSGFFQGVKGVIFGIFFDCERNDADTQTLLEVIKDRTIQIGAPAIYGFSFGHMKNQCTFPLGAKAELNATINEVIIYNDSF